MIHCKVLFLSVLFHFREELYYSLMGQTFNSPHQKGIYRARAVGQIHKAMTQVYLRGRPPKKVSVGSLCYKTAPDRQGRDKDALYRGTTKRREERQKLSGSLCGETDRPTRL